VLRDDGSWWLNLGDSYASKPGWGGQSGAVGGVDAGVEQREKSLDRKQKMLIPHRVAIALQDAGWVVRNDVTWVKPNPMPSPVKDRLNTATEQIFHLTPEPDYWYDLDAVREEHAEQSIQRSQREDNRHEHSERQSAATEETLDPAQFVHPAGKNPGDVFEVTTKPFPEAHFAVYPPELCETPIKASCPPKVCAECAAPYERHNIEKPLWERDPETVDRPQAKRAVELAEQHDLTDDHMAAARAVNIGDADGSEGNPYERVDDETERLARETKDALGAYYREFAFSGTETVDSTWRQACDCDTNETQAGIALDPFAGAGTTALVAKRLGRRFVGIDLNPEYVAMAQKRVGIDVDEPELLLDGDETPLQAFTDGGGRR
jgi:DNA modification methylase